MKKFVVPLIVLVAVAATIWAAAPSMQAGRKNPTDKTVTAYAGQTTTYTPIDSATSVTATDSCLQIVTLSGQAVFSKPGAVQIFVGVLAADTVSGFKDTFTIQSPFGQRGQAIIPFTCVFSRQHLTQTDSTANSFYWRAAMTERSKSVVLQNLLFTLQTQDIDTLES